MLISKSDNSGNTRGWGWSGLLLFLVIAIASEFYTNLTYSKYDLVAEKYYNRLEISENIMEYSEKSNFKKSLSASYTWRYRNKASIYEIEKYITQEVIKKGWQITKTENAGTYIMGKIDEEWNFRVNIKSEETTITLLY